MHVGLLIASCLTASLSPGPAALSTIETSLRYGQRRTFWHTLGLAVGETPKPRERLRHAMELLGPATSKEAKAWTDLLTAPPKAE